MPHASALPWKRCSGSWEGSGGVGGEPHGELNGCTVGVVATPLTAETRGRIGTAEVNLLPRHAYVVNVGRAEIAERALYDALVSGSIAGAAIDVWYRYPPPGENSYGSRLPFHAQPNVICTPHYSAWTRPMIRRRVDRMSDNLCRLTDGDELERVVLQGE